jgi:hypothetical protein
VSTELVTPVRELSDDHELPRPLVGGPPRYFALGEPAPGVLLAGTCGRGVARSLDGGCTWSVVGDMFVGSNVNAFNPGRDGELYAAAGGAGLAVSYDDGASWSAIPCGDASVYCVASVDRQLLAGTTEGVISRSAEGTWTPVFDGPASDVYRLYPLADGSVAAATERSGVWLRAIDGTWQSIGLDDVPVFALLELDGGDVLAGTRGRGVMRWSRDGGWREVAGQPADPVVHAIELRLDGSLVAGTGQGVVSSPDGESWEPLGSELAQHRMFAVLVRSDGSLLASSYDGVWAYDTGRDDWSPVDTGLDVGAVFAIAIRDGVVYAGGRAGAFRSADRGDTWQQIRPAELAGNAYSFCLSGSDLYVGTDDGLWHAGSGLPGEAWIRAGLDDLRVYTVIEIASGHLMAGTLGAGVWSRPGADAAWHRCGGLDAPLAFDLIRSPSTGEMLVGGGTIVDGLKAGGVYRSADGERWDSAELEPNTVYDVVELSSGVILAGAQRSKILRSDDGARTFVTTRPNGRAESKMYSLSRGIGDAVYLGAGAELLRSHDAGDSWEVVSRGMDGVTVYGVVAFEDGTLLAATSSGVYRSSDDALSWSPVDWNA